MTRKDFVLIAAAVAGAQMDDAARSATVAALTTALATTNPNFDRDRFIKACWATN